MDRTELIEWIIIILCVVLWWPLMFHFNPAWYRTLLYVGEPIVLLVILIRRFRRMKSGFDYSEQVMKSQVPGRPQEPKDQ
jgi:hypothetical protein